MLITALLLVSSGAEAPAIAPALADSPFPWDAHALEPLALEPPHAEDGGGGWSLTLTPYLWMFGIDGTVRAGNAEADVEIGFDDVVENLDFAFMLHSEVRKGPFAIYFDPTYGNLEAEADVLGPNDANVDIELVMVEFGTMYRVLEQEPGSERQQFLDVTLGARYVSLESEIDFQVLPDQAGGVDFIDLTVGAGFGMELTEKLGFYVGGDVGGFGIGSSSEFTWSAMGLGVWNLGDTTRLLFGYRALDIDRDESSSNSGGDFQLSGPLLGIAINV